ncbi:hypothetical protein VPHK391_0014 [Vibrio phage K391]
MTDWKTVNGWKELPQGFWLVRHDTPRVHHQYSVADKGEKICICGNAFAFDLPPIVAYRELPTYELPTEQS